VPRVRAAFGDGVAYASKAFLCVAMARSCTRRASTSTSRPAASCTSRSRGFPAERIVFHGNNKSTAELRAALEAGVGRIVVDSFDELDRLEALVRDGLPARVCSCA
jgi:diaminopimelate decarboxylase